MVLLENGSKVEFAKCKDAFWHTSSHILAQAVKRLYPDAQLAIGPSVSNGFYYDIDCDTRFTEDILPQIEAEMVKITKENFKIERFEKSKSEAIEQLQDQPYKLELVRELDEDAVVSFYQQGEFCDMCAGPHIAYTGSVGAIKLTSSTGAYWRGDSNNKMLQRIYGVSFEKPKELREYLAAVEEAKKRDHKKIGRDLEYFTTADVVGQGLPILLPKGARVIQLLQRFVEDEEQRRGYVLTKTPLMGKSDIYKISGHWSHYRDGMFIIGDPENDEASCLALRPMTCPFQYQVFLNRKRSYRDLPMRLGETSTLFRNEDSGEMHGLIRVRQFTISEGHLIVRPDQLAEEFAGCLELARYMLDILGLEEDCSYRFSRWDPKRTDKYEGTAKQWEEAESIMEKILVDLDVEYVDGMDEAAFYGPKLDIQTKNVHGKEDTIITIQIDMLLAEKFGMEYVGDDGGTHIPYIIHRTSIGCYERTLALMIEKYAGALPVWLMPEQVRIVPISEAHHEYAKEVEKQLFEQGIRVSSDCRGEKMGYKIREAQLEKIPYMLVVGDKEMADRTVAVRSPRNENYGGVKPIAEFIDMINDQIVNRTR